MPDYEKAQIDVLAKVLVRIPEVELEYGVNWGDAKKVKAEAAKWLSKVDQSVLPSEITVLVTIEQRSDDVPDFVDGAPWCGKTNPRYAIEYGCAFLKNFATWGRGR